MKNLALVAAFVLLSACGDGTGSPDATTSGCSPACGPSMECCRNCDGPGGTCVVPGSCGVCPMGEVCGAITCGVGEQCCRSCDGSESCGPDCPMVSCDAGAGDAAVADASIADAGTNTCPDGTCRLSADGACEAPTGPTGNGCCECTASECTSRCRCLSGATTIATPGGEVPVSDLRVGDLVYSVHEDAVVPVPIARVVETPVSDHVVMRVSLASGVTLRVSPRHPTADGRDFGGLAAGDRLDGIEVLEAELVPYEEAFTYDVLPASDTGTYYAGGALIGSTLFGL